MEGSYSKYGTHQITFPTKNVTWLESEIESIGSIFKPDSLIFKLTTDLGL